MKKPFDLLAVGEILLRLSPPGYERLAKSDSFTRYVGGAELNVLANASLLGLNCGLVSKLPQNDIGAYAREAIREAGVAGDYLIGDADHDARLGLYYCERAAHPRKPKVVYDRLHSSFTKIKEAELADDMFSAARCFHTSGITLGLGGSARETAVAMIKRFKAQGALISFDVNYRANLWSGDEARACIEKILPYVDIFFCSESTARLTFLKTGPLEDVMRSFTEEYPVSVVVSTERTVHSPQKHTFTSVLYSKKNDEFYREEPYRDIGIVDRIGSGDAYVGGVLYGLLSAPGDYSRAVAYGNAISAAKNTVPGDMPAASREEIDALIAAHQSGGEQLEMSR